MQRAPRAHIGARVRFIGTVVGQVARRGKVVTLQVTDVSGRYEDLNVIVYTDKLQGAIGDGWVVLVSGKVADALRVRTTTRVTLLLPAVYAEQLSVLSTG